MNRRLSALGIILGASGAAHADRVTMTAHAVKLYRVAVSTDMLCANPVVLVESAAPATADLMAQTPSFTSPADGTFRCLMMEISDRLRFAGGRRCPLAETRICASGTEFESLDGKTGTCSGGENKVTLYYSLASRDDQGRAKIFLAPISRRDALHGIRLESPIVLKKGATYHLKLDGGSRLESTGDTCRLVAPPQVSFVE